MKLERIIVVYSLVVLLYGGCGKISNETGEPDIPAVDVEQISESFQIDGFIDQLKLRWDHHEGAITYEIRYAENGQNMDGAVTLETASSSVLVTGLESGQQYEIQIRVNDGSEWTDWSDPLLAETALFKTRISTYNVLSAQYDHQFPGSTWADRKFAVRDIIRQEDHNPDIITVQELMDPHQAEEMAELLAPEYDGYVSDKDVSARGIFWKKDKYTLVDSDDFDILGNEISGYSTTRIATYVRLQHIASRKELMVFNIHLPWGRNADAQRARHKGADNFSNIIFELSGDNTDLYAIVPGDYNNYPETVIDGWPSSPQTFSNNEFRDAFNAALNVENGDYGTTNDILEAEARIGQNGNMRVDYIFIYPSEQVAVSDYKTIINLAANSNTEMEQPVPSDHHPVRAVFHLSY